MPGLISQTRLNSVALKWRAKRIFMVRWMVPASFIRGDAVAGLLILMINHRRSQYWYGTA